MLRINPHGGQCCGIANVFNFTEGDEEADIIALSEILLRRNQHNTGLLTEVVLTNTQLRTRPRLVAFLKETGFVLGPRFLNENSGNICNVFYYTNAGRSLTRLPFAWR